MPMVQYAIMRSTSKVAPWVILSACMHQGRLRLLVQRRQHQHNPQLCICKHRQKRSLLLCLIKHTCWCELPDGFSLRPSLHDAPRRGQPHG